VNEHELLSSIGYLPKRAEPNGHGPSTGHALIERLAYLGDHPSADEVFAILQEANPPGSRLERQWLRERLLQLLRGKMRSPAGIIDAWLSPLGSGEREGQGSPLELSEPEPWPNPVDGGALLSAMDAVVRRFVVLSDAARAGIALWILHAYVLDAFAISPILVITSPTKRCGKTNVMRLLALLTPKALLSSNVSPAALFRTVEKWRPTLLMDEADTFVRLSEEHRGLLNAGHTRDAAMVIRTVGDDHEPRVFSTWCPKAVAAIGRLPDTVEDRAVVISMRRKTAEESVDRLRPDRLSELTEPIRRRGARWGADYVERLRDADPDPIPGLNDRAQDNWLPLLAVAEMCGPDWVTSAHQAANEASDVVDDEGAAILLLTDMAAFFADRGEDALPTQELLQALHQMEDRPWGEFRRGRPLSAPQLARYLKEFGVKPRPFSGGKVRGYRLEDGLSEAFHRYVPQESRADPSHRHTKDVPAGQLVLSGSDQHFTESTFVTDRESSHAADEQGRQPDRDGLTGSDGKGAGVEREVSEGTST
jgi:putative DNA primase/helicase